jgi:uncharacterized membrane protein YgdD (TMEM256/DUF423 family)
MTVTRLIQYASLSAACAVLAGAFGAHMATGKAVEWLHTGALYQLTHAVAVIATAHISGVSRQSWLLLMGSSLFALTLYLMALGFPTWLGAITPIGGMLMIIGWMWIALTALRIKKSDDIG